MRPGRSHELSSFMFLIAAGVITGFVSVGAAPLFPAGRRTR